MNVSDSFKDVKYVVWKTLMPCIYSRREWYQVLAEILTNNRLSFRFRDIAICAHFTIKYANCTTFRTSYRITSRHTSASWEYTLDRRQEGKRKSHTHNTFGRTSGSHNFSSFGVRENRKRKETRVWVITRDFLSFFLFCSVLLSLLFFFFFFFLFFSKKKIRLGSFSQKVQRSLVCCSSDLVKTFFSSHSLSLSLTLSLSLKLSKELRLQRRPSHLDLLAN